MDEISKPTPPEIKFGFPMEHTTAQGAYICVFPGFAEFAIHASHQFLIYRYLDGRESKSGYVPTNHIHRVECDGILHALGEIYHLLQENGIEYLPAEVSEVQGEADVAMKSESTTHCERFPPGPLLPVEVTNAKD